jgi:hypothetical protein
MRGIAILKEEGLARVRLSDGEVLGEGINVAIFQEWTTGGPSKSQRG